MSFGIGVLAAIFLWWGFYCFYKYGYYRGAEDLAIDILRRKSNQPSAEKDEGT